MQLGEPLPPSDARPNAEIERATVSALPWLALARVVIEVFVFASMVVLARLMPPSAFGVFAIVIIVQELAWTLPGESIGNALVQRKIVTREHLQGGFAFGLLMGAAFAVLTLVAAATVVRSIFGDEAALLIALTAPWYVLAAIAAVPAAVLRRRLDFRKMAILDLVHALVRAATAVLFASVFALDTMALWLGSLAGVCANVLLAVAFAPPPFPRWRSRAVRDLLPYAGPSVLAAIAWTGYRNGDYAIVGARLGTAAAGLYWRGYQLGVEYQRKVSGVMSQVLFPMLARATNAGELSALRERMARLDTVVVFPLLAMLIVVAPVVIPWVFGPEWKEAVVPAQVLAVGGAAMVMTDVAGSVLKAVGRSTALLNWSIAHFVVYGAAVLVASNYGLTAVCVVAGAAHVVFAVMGYAMLVEWHVGRALRLFWNDARAATVSCVPLLACAWPAFRLLGDEGVPVVPRLAVVVSVGVLAYAASLRLWFPAAYRDLAALVRRVVPTARLMARVRRSGRFGGEVSSWEVDDGPGAAEVGGGDERVGGVEAEAAVAVEADAAVEAIEAAVGESELGRGEDPGAVAADRAREPDERAQARA